MAYEKGDMPNTRMWPMKGARDYRAILKQVVDFINVDDCEAEKLWQVLTALRGPDGDPSGSATKQIESKRATTAIVRNAIGVTYYGIDVNPDNAVHAQMRCDMTGYSHFKQHLMSAFDVLGLEWFSDNSQQESVVVK